MFVKTEWSCKIPYFMYFVIYELRFQFQWEKYVLCRGLKANNVNENPLICYFGVLYFWW